MPAADPFSSSIKIFFAFSDGIHDNSLRLTAQQHDDLIASAHFISQIDGSIMWTHAGESLTMNYLFFC